MRSGPGQWRRYELRRLERRCTGGTPRLVFAIMPGTGAQPGSQCRLGRRAGAQGEQRESQQIPGVDREQVVRSERRTGPHRRQQYAWRAARTVRRWDALVSLRSWRGIPIWVTSPYSHGSRHLPSVGICKQVTALLLQGRCQLRWQRISAPGRKVCRPGRSAVISRIPRTATRAPS